jgi:hypothetical protein
MMLQGSESAMRLACTVGAMLLLCNATSAIASDIAVVGTGDGMEVLRAVGAAYRWWR